MTINDVRNNTLDAIGHFVFPNAQAPVRRRDTRAFLASLAIGLVVCFLFGYVLCLMQKHGGM